MLYCGEPCFAVKIRDIKEWGVDEEDGWGGSCRLTAHTGCSGLAQPPERESVNSGVTWLLYLSWGIQRVIPPLQKVDGGWLACVLFPETLLPETLP